MTLAETLHKIEEHPFTRKLEVKHEDGASWTPSRWINRDIVPLPPYRRRWGPWTFVGFWLVAGVNISGWVCGSSLISLGLNVPQAMAVVIFAYATIAALFVGTGLPGGKYHICFAVIGRYSWGLRGSFFVLINRILLSITWHGVQAYFGGKCIRLLIGSVFPSFYKLNRPLAGGTIDSSSMIGVIIFNLLEVPLLWFPPEIYHKPFFVSSSLVCIVIVSMLIWATAKAHGAGSLISNTSGVAGVEQAHGAKLAWAMIYGYSSVIGSVCAGILNQSDYTRFARKPRDQVLGQVFIIPTVAIVTGMIGIIVTSCAAKFYPDEKLLWEPYNLLYTVQMRSGPGARAAIFFATICWTAQQLAINVSWNAIGGGIDMSGIWPRYLNIRRGAYITAACGLLMQPWQLLNGSTVFISVISGYAVFLAPFTGILIADFLFVRKQKIKLTDLYDPTPNSIYFFTKGVNLRAPLAWVLGVWPTMPGFIAKVSKKTDSIAVGWLHTYYMCYPLGFTLSFLAFIALSKLWPPDGLGIVDEEDYFGTYGDAPGTSDSERTEEESSKEKSDEKPSPQVTDLPYESPT